MRPTFDFYRVEIDLDDGNGWHEDYDTYEEAVTVAQAYEVEWDGQIASLEILGNGGPAVEWEAADE